MHTTQGLQGLPQKLYALIVSKFGLDDQSADLSMEVQTTGHPGYDYHVSSNFGDHWKYSRTVEVWIV